MQRCGCVMEADCWSHLVDLERIGQWSRSFSTYLVASKIQSGECLEEEMQRCGCVMEADCWSHLVDLERIGQWSRSFITYPVVFFKIQSGECLDEEMQRCGCVMEADCWSHLVDLERIGQWSRSFSTYPVASKDPEWWVSRGRDAEVRVCDGSRLLISPGWSWAHRPVISLLQHLSGCLPKIQSGECLDEEMQRCSGVWWKQIVDRTWLILSASASDLAPSAPIWLSPKIQSGECLEEEMQRCGCVMEADCWSHLVDLERIGQWSRSFSTYLVASKIQSGECLEEEMQRCGCVMEADCWSHLVDLERIGQWSRSFSTYLVACCRSRVVSV